MAVVEIIILALFALSNADINVLKRWQHDLDHEDVLRIPNQKVEVNDTDIWIYLYTNQNPTEPIILGVQDMEILQNSPFNSALKTVIAIHGFSTDASDSSNLVVRDAAFQKIECNFLVIDWSSIANLDYFSAKDSLPNVARVIADFINRVMLNFDLSIENIVVYGHSLGGQLVGFVGETMGGNLPVIVSLDPAYPYFNCSLPENCVDPSDARFVQVIHTSTWFPGHPDPLGHADFYPNGGESQVGCEGEVLGECSHARAWIYFAESVVTGGFTATECVDWDNFTANACEGNPTAAMGGVDFNIDTGARGSFYLNVNGDPPHSVD